MTPVERLTTLEREIAEVAIMGANHTTGFVRTPQNHHVFASREPFLNNGTHISSPPHELGDNSGMNVLVRQEREF